MHSLLLALEVWIVVGFVLWLVGVGVMWLVGVGFRYDDDPTEG